MTNTQSTHSILDVQVHARLLADRDQVLSIAGVQNKFLTASITTYCHSIEVDWVKNFKKYRTEGMPGLVLEGVNNPDARCQAIAGALLRNFIDARVIPMGTLLDMEDKVVNPTVLLVPNFFVQVSGKGHPSWKLQSFYDLLLNRAVHNKPTVLFIQNKDEFEKVFGSAFSDFLSQFRWVK